LRKKSHRQDLGKKGKQERRITTKMNPSSMFGQKSYERYQGAKREGCRIKTLVERDHPLVVTAQAVLMCRGRSRGIGGGGLIFAKKGKAKSGKTTLGGLKTPMFESDPVKTRKAGGGGDKMESSWLRTDGGGAARKKGTVKRHQRKRR